jgi:hypothetical protein
VVGGRDAQELFLAHPTDARRLHDASTENHR